MATSDRFSSLALPLDYSKKAIWRAAAPLLTPRNALAIAIYRNRKTGNVWIKR
jgi:hypothetical protein